MQQQQSTDTDRPTTRRSRPQTVVRYRVTMRRRCDDGRYEVVVCAWASENPATLGGWNLAGAAFHRDPDAALSTAVRHLQRTMGECGIYAAVVPAPPADGR